LRAAPLVFALGGALPLFGIPLAAFLLSEVVTGTIRGRREDRPLSEVPVSPAPAGS